MKSKGELNSLKIEYESLCKKLDELSQDELKEVAGGMGNGCNYYYCDGIKVCPLPEERIRRYIESGMYNCKKCEKNYLNDKKN